MNQSKPHILEYSAVQLRAWLSDRGLPGYRAGQIRSWLFERPAADFDAMLDLPKSLRATLAESFTLWTSEVVQENRAEDGTVKLLLEMADGERIECVLLSDDRGHRTACISTQVGCAMGCVFCASGLDGMVRNLTSGEILQQLLHLRRLLAGDERLSHIVVMGVGEPLANLGSLLPALAIATSPDGLGISQRRVTISTVGLPKGIERLAHADLQYHLAISLHAPGDALRTELIPTNQKTGIGPILAAADEYFETTGRRVTYEYILLAGVNDSSDDARQLIARLKGRPALVNVIPYNPVAGLPYETPSTASTKRFIDLLENAGLSVKARYRKGDRISAACGQLRRSHR